MARNAIVSIILNLKDNASAGLAVASGRVKKFGQDVKASLSGVQGAFAALGVTLSAGAIIGYVVKANAEFQRFGAQLRVFSGSAAGAAGVMADLRKLAVDLPFDLANITKSYIMLRAAGVDPSTETIRRFADIASAMGRPIEDIANATKSALAGEMEPMKQFGFTFRAEGGKIKASFGDVTKSIGNDAGSMIQFLDEIAQAKFAGAAAARMQTMEGAFSNLQDAAWGLAVAVGDTGLRRDIGDLLLSITATTNEVGKDTSTLKAWMTVITQTVKVTYALVSNTFSAFFNLGKSIGFVLKGVVEGIMGAITAVVSSTGTVIGAFVSVLAPKLGKAITDASQAGLNVAGNFFKGVKASAQDSVDSLGNVGLAVLETGDAFVTAYDKIANPEKDGFARGSTGKGRGLAKNTSAVNRQIFAGAAGADSPAEENAKTIKYYAEIAQLRDLEKADLDKVREAEVKLAAIRDNEKEKIGERIKALAALAEARKLAYPVEKYASESGALLDLFQSSKLTTDQMERLYSHAAKLRDLLKSGLLTPEEAAKAAKALREVFEKGPAAMVLAYLNNATSGVGGGNGNGNASQSHRDRIGITLQNATSDAKSFGNTLDDLTANSVADFVGAFVDSFSLLSEGWAGVGDAMRTGMLGAIGAVAKGLASLYIQKAVANIGEAISHPTLAANKLAGAAKFMAAAAGFAALGGALGGGGGGGGSRGGGLSSSAGNLGDASKNGEATIILNGSSNLNMNDPKTQDEFRAMLEKLTGRRVTIRA